MYHYWTSCVTADHSFTFEMVFIQYILCFVLGLLFQGLPDILAASSTDSDALVCNNTLSCQGNCRNRRQQQGVRQRNHVVHPPLLPTCVCDDHCPIFGDCCADYYHHCKTSTQTGDILHAISSFEIIFQGTEYIQKPHINGGASAFMGNRNELMTLRPHMKCTKVKSSSSTTGHVWMISSCPETFHSDHTSEPSCENPGKNPLLQGPVSIAPNLIILFKNALCARCHGIGEDSVVPWPVMVNCPNGKNLSILAPNVSNTLNHNVMSKMLNSPGCEIVYESNMWQFVRNCTPSSVLSECPEFKKAYGNKSTEAIKLNNLCHLYLNVIRDTNGVKYKNVHCAMCTLGEKYAAENMRCDLKGEGLVFTTALNVKVDGTIHSTTPTSPEIVRPKVASLKILFNFDGNGMSYTVGKQQYRVQETHKLCKPDEVYDTLTLSCTTLYCRPDKYPANGTCHLKNKGHIAAHSQVFESGPRYFVLVCYVNPLPGSTSDDLEDMFQRVFIQKMNYFMASSSNSKIRVLDYIKEDIMPAHNTTISSMLPSLDDSSLAIKVLLTFYTDNPASLVLSACRDILKLFPEELELKAWSMTSGYLKDYREDDRLSCPALHTLTDFNATLDTDHQPYNAVVNWTYFPVDNVPFVYQVHPFVATNSTVRIKGCVSDLSLLPECASLRYDATQYIVTNGTLSLLHSNLVFEEDAYKLFSNYAYVCESNLTRDYIEHTRFYFFRYSHVQFYLTIITSLISVTFLVGTLIVYCLLPELRNVPGKIVMSLSGTLMVSQSLQLVMTLPKGILCVAVAAVAHAAWISTFFWMTIITFDLVCTLRSDHLVTDTKSRRRKYSLYAIFAWVVPSVACGCLVCVDHWKLYGIDISYGANGICWIGNSDALFWVFGLPFGICLLINFTCFCATLYIIETKSKIHQASMSGRQERQKLFIYGKLSLISGLSWVFCFSAAHANVSILWDFQIVLNGLQGCYIFLGFVGKRRIFKLLRIKTVSKLSKSPSSIYTGSLSVYK